jgi:hypothetical protein
MTEAVCVGCSRAYDEAALGVPLSNVALTGCKVCSYARLTDGHLADAALRRALASQGQIAELFQMDERTVRRRWQSACLKLNRQVGGQLPQA